VPRYGKAKIGARKVTVGANGVAGVPMVCASGVCRGTLTLEASLGERLLSVRTNARKIKLGSKRFSFRAGQRGVVRVKLSRVAIRALRRLGKLRATAVVRTSDGKRTASAIVLRAGRR
jgi:hypothetical protein